MKIFIHGSRRKIEQFDAGLVAKIWHHVCQLADTLTVSRSFYNSIVAKLGPLNDSIRPIDHGDAIDADLALSFGGDGSFLRTARWVGASGIPILGINAGHLGFLTDFTIDDFLAADTRTLSNLRFEPRKVLHVECSRPLPDDCWPYALNDVALLKNDTASMISVETNVNGTPLTTYQADGLIIATPTGSTGYNLSVGGPILSPTVNALLLSPVAPHLLAMRPLAVDGNARIDLAVQARKGVFMLSLDGRSLPMSAGTKISVEAAPFHIIVAQNPDHDFAKTIRIKLLWGERPVRQ
ncbi:MAG: NAD(+)/NADH kinase [Bacteroides sp.]|nr:NAD(+)/NADH kinase [Bacteroides sp.]MCM1379426.1 NAD(+)/NADH kinase [Bacteroides sp.]MCM1445286.1 NAD(+)/NADH kinase [Prevotella sp.]